LLTDNFNANRVAYVALDKLWHRRACGQGPIAPTEIPATAGFHHEGAIRSSVTVDIQKHSAAGQNRHEGRFRDVSWVKGLTAFD